MSKRWLQSATVEINEATAALRVQTGLEGCGKPDLLTWSAGSSAYAAPTSGSITHDSAVLFVTVGVGGALLSVADPVGQERPYIIPANHWREIAIPGGIAAASRIVAKNLSGTNFAGLIVEVR